MNEDIQHELKEKISEIERKSANGDYIYRGEPKTSCPKSLLDSLPPRRDLRNRSGML